jgi:hypothetical protein
VTSGLTETARTGLGLLRRLAAAFTGAAPLDEVARAALTTALGIPGAARPDSDHDEVQP